MILVRANPLQGSENQDFFGGGTGVEGSVWGLGAVLAARLKKKKQVHW